MEKMYDYSMKNKRFSCGVCHNKGKAIYFLKGVLFRKSKASAHNYQFTKREKNKTLPSGTC
jgi:hypothetical protein